MAVCYSGATDNWDDTDSDVDDDNGVDDCFDEDPEEGALPPAHIQCKDPAIELQQRSLDEPLQGVVWNSAVHRNAADSHPFHPRGPVGNNLDESMKTIDVFRFLFLKPRKSGELRPTDMPGSSIQSEQ